MSYSHHRNHRDSETSYRTTDQIRFLEESGFVLGANNGEEGSFDQHDEDDDSLLDGESARRRKWIDSSHGVYMADLIFGNLSLLNLWRFSGLTFALSVQWSATKFGIFNFLIPYIICLIVIATPLLIAEIGLSQCVRGSSAKTFGSLSLRARFGGLSWMCSSLVCVFASALCAYSFAFLVTSGEHKGSYFTHLSELQSCTKYNQYLPQIQPRMCFPDSTRLDAACYGSLRTCPMWDGDGRCMAVPWGPASEDLLNNAENVCPWLLNDYPIYCGARHLHDLTTNESYAVATRQALWSDYGANLSWRLPVGFTLTWVLVAILAFVRVGWARVVRITVGLFASIMILILLFSVMSSAWENAAVSAGWFSQLFAWHPSSLGRVEIWAHALVQSLVTLSLAQNVVPDQHHRSPKDTMNIVRSALFMILGHFIVLYIVIVTIYLAYAALSTWTYPLADIHPLYGPVSLDARNIPMGTFFTVLGTWFDNSAFLDGRSPRPAALAGAFWLSMFALGVVGVSRNFCSIVDTLYVSSGNWNRGFSRWLIVLGLALMMFVSTVYLWFGVSWAAFMLLQHIVANMILPLFALAQLIAIGWVFGWRERVKHFGASCFLLQSVLYTAGALLIACATAYLSVASKVWKMVACWIAGLGLVVFSVLIPPVTVRSHDVYGRKHAMSKVMTVILVGSVDHLRKEMNYRTCHTARILKLHMSWTLLIKYVAPIGVLIAWFSFFVRDESLAVFSPYRPFFNDQVDAFSLVESMFLSSELALPKFLIWVPFTLCILPLLTVVATAIMPNWLDWHVPKDTDEHFWNVRKAVELFASHVATSQTPVRLHSATVSHFPNAQEYPGQSIYQPRGSAATLLSRDEEENKRDQALRTGREVADSSSSASRTPPSDRSKPTTAPTTMQTTPHKRASLGARALSPLEPEFAPSESDSDEDDLYLSSS